jgi:acetyltransferase-like isoleucine patch superfamily enzyme
MKNTVDKNLIFLEKEYDIDDNVIIGYLPARKIANYELHIGKGAKIRNGTIIYAGTKIGENLETGHNCIIREECVIGNNLKIWSNSVIDYGCIIGNNVHIHNLVYVCQYSIIEDDVFLAPGVCLANDKYPVRKFGWEGPKILKGARIGMNAVILPGVIIGEGALVGAGSVVTKNVPPHSVVFGNPAKVFSRD